MNLEHVAYTTVVLPAYWATYLINGDASGLDDSEKAVCDMWLARNHDLYFVDCSEPYFARDNEATHLAGDVCDYTALLPPYIPQP